MTFLGFNLHSDKMLVTPTEKKVIKTKEFITSMLSSGPQKIRTVALLVGVLNDLVKGVDYGGAHVKGVEREKNFALTLAGDLQFEAYMSLQTVAISDLKWWYDANRKIRINTPTVTLATDASREGWGGVSGDQSVSARWTTQEETLHINVLEILAVLHSLEALFGDANHVHFKILCDNTTAVTYLNNGGGTWSDNCNVASKMVWNWCQTRELDFSYSYTWLTKQTSRLCF